MVTTVEWWKASSLPWRVGDTVTATSTYARGTDQDAMLWVHEGEQGRVIALRDGWAPDQHSPYGMAAWAVIEWPSGMRDARQHPDTPREDD